AEGGYESVAERVFGGLNVDRFLLEYDSERAGGFEPLRFVPPGKTVVLGLITTKSGELEAQDAVLRRIEAAARYVPLDRLALSPPRGFATNEQGHGLSDAGVFLARERGYFREQGIDVDLVPFQSGPDTMVPMASGDLEVGSGNFGIVWLNAVERGVGINAVADKGHSSPGFEFVQVP